MASAGGLTNGLALVSGWLSNSSDADLEPMLREWVQQSGWSSVGVLLSPQEPTAAGWVATPNETKTTTDRPPELPEVLKSLRDGQPTVVWQTPGTSGRLYALLSLAGASSGVVWAERLSREPWGDAERGYFHLATKVLERSVALGKKVGPILEPVRLEQRLKDAAVIAGRMAHDFDNILTGIMGFADLTQPLLAGQSQAAKYVAEISKVGQRGIVFTQQLHQLSRSAQVKPQPGSVGSVLAGEEKRVRPLLPAGASLTVEVQPNLPAVAMEAGAVQTVLAHLIDNAAEASAAGGKITVTARPVELHEADARRYLGRATGSQYVEVTIRDHGAGIKPEVRARLFVEPFYTTKIRHRGLGLATVFRVLFAHRGGIRVDAATPPELGSVVRVVLPLAAVRSAVAPATNPALGVSS